MAQPDADLPPPPEARLLKRARDAWQPRKLSMREAAAKAGVSETTWRHTEAGAEPRGSQRFPYKAGDSTLARMARAVRLTPEALRSAGRPEAAAVLQEIRKDGSDPDNWQIAECVYEEEILTTPDISDDSKRQLVRVHRRRGHSERCGPFAEPRRDEQRSALPAAAAG